MTQLDVSRPPRPVWNRREGQTLVPGVAAWRRLGVGLRCETWLGWSNTGRHPVVVKLARPHQVDHPRAWASLTREVYVLTRARHPNLPVLYADGVRGAVPHVVLEHVDGPELADEIDDGGPLDPLSAARLAAQLLSAVAAVHATGAAHLDVKPENVIVRDGRPVLIDFGSARPLGSPQPAGRPVGTLGWAAPEMERCEPISAAMDVYGVGAVLADALPRPTRRRRSARLMALDTAARRLCDPDPRTRPSVSKALDVLAAAVAPERLWPDFVCHGS